MLAQNLLPKDHCSESQCGIRLNHHRKQPLAPDLFIERRISANAIEIILRLEPLANVVARLELTQHQATTASRLQHHVRQLFT